jgi:hypothetical protein
MVSAARWHRIPNVTSLFNIDKHWLPISAPLTLLIDLYFLQFMSWTILNTYIGSRFSCSWKVLQTKRVLFTSLKAACL